MQGVRALSTGAERRSIEKKIYNDFIVVTW
jgi:hypothetical protein